MKTINVTFEDKEVRDLEKIKKEDSWHDFILNLAIKKGDGENGEQKN